MPIETNTQNEPSVEDRNGSRIRRAVGRLATVSQVAWSRANVLALRGISAAEAGKERFDALSDREKAVAIAAGAIATALVMRVTGNLGTDDIAQMAGDLGEKAAKHPPHMVMDDFHDDMAA